MTNEQTNTEDKIKNFRVPSPHADASLKVYSLQTSSLNAGLLPREPCWLALVLPGLPILMSGVLCLPLPLLHLTHTLQALENKKICSDVSPHVTFDVSVFILAYVLPVLLVAFLVIGLVVRRCLRCSLGHCCNSWCKEEVVMVIQFVVLTVSHALLYLPVVDAFAKKVQLPNHLRPFLTFVTQDLARAVEMAAGVILPISCYVLMPAYRQFCTEPDPDDLKLSAPEGYKSVSGKAAVKEVSSSGRDTAQSTTSSTSSPKEDPKATIRVHDDKDVM